MSTIAHNTFYSTILFLGGFQALFLAFVLLKHNNGFKHANRYLAICLFALGIHVLHQFLIVSNYISLMKPLVGVNLPFDYVGSSCVYLYIRALIRPDLAQIRRPTEFLHFIPVPGLALLLIPFYMLDYEQKLSIALQSLASTTWEGSVTGILPAYLTITQVAFAIYLIASYRLLHAHKKEIKHYFSYNENVTLSWLSQLVYVFFIIFSIIVIYLMVNDSPALAERVVDGLFLFVVFAIHYLGVGGLLQPEIFKLDENTPQKLSHLNQAEETKLEKPSAKYQHSALDKEQQIRIIGRLSAHMQNEQPYLNSRITLPKLASQLSTSPNYLSQALNEHLKCTFFDYINALRVETAKELLMNASKKNLSVLDIAMESAFNSKSAFYAAFRKHTGMTPVQYRKSQGNGPSIQKQINLDPGV